VNEAQLEVLFRRRVRGVLGGIVIQLAPTVAGIPDRLVILPGGRMYLVELKTETGRLRPAQVAWIARAAERGTYVAVLHGVAGVLGWVTDRVNETTPEGVHAVSTRGKDRVTRKPRVLPEQELDA